MAKQPKGEWVVVGFNYDLLEAKIAEADLAIQPTAAYLQAAPSAPDEARQAAGSVPKKSKKITTVVPKAIVAEAKKKRPRCRMSRRSGWRSSIEREAITCPLMNGLFPTNSLVLRSTTRSGSWRMPAAVRTRSG